MGEYRTSPQSFQKRTPLYLIFFKHTRLELRTKSANISELKKLKPLKNVIVSFSLSPKDQVKDHDLKTPPLATRLKAIQSLVSLGHPIALHFDPVIYVPDFKEQYRELLQSLMEVLTPQSIEYISFGVVRFNKDVFHQVKKNYPNSKFTIKSSSKALMEKSGIGSLKGSGCFKPLKTCALTLIERRTALSLHGRR